MEQAVGWGEGVVVKSQSSHGAPCGRIVRDGKQTGVGSESQAVGESQDDGRASVGSSGPVLLSSFPSVTLFLSLSVSLPGGGSLQFRTLCTRHTQFGGL